MLAREIRTEQGIRGSLPGHGRLWRGLLRLQGRGHARKTRRRITLIRQTRQRGRGRARRIGILRTPLPFLSELFIQKADLPAGFLADLLEHAEDLFLFAAVGEAFGGDGEGAQGDGGDAAVFAVRDDAADLAGVCVLHVVHLRLLDGHDGADLREEAHGGVEEEAGGDGGAFDEPGRRGFWLVSVTEEDGLGGRS